MAADANARQSSFFTSLLSNPSWTVLVAKQNEIIQGFIIGEFFKPLPVYQADAPVLMVDDYCLKSPHKWEGLGVELLAELEEVAKSNGIGLTVVVAADKDTAKTGMLTGEGFSLASQWYYRKI